MPYRYIFKPRLAATLVTVLLCALFVRLGYWQLHRAEYKRTLQTQLLHGQQHTVPLTAANAAQLMRFQHVQVTGYFDTTRQVLLDNIPSQQGLPGFHVLTPLHLIDGAIVLVDRGWLPLRTRSELPDVAVDTRSRSIQGLMDTLPQPGIRLGDVLPTTHTWPLVANFPRHEDLQPLFSTALLTNIVLLDATEPDGFERQWHQDTAISATRHLAYAIQWFGFALTLVIIYGVVNTQRMPQR